MTITFQPTVTLFPEMEEVTPSASPTPAEPATEALAPGHLEPTVQALPPTAGSARSLSAAELAAWSRSHAQAPVSSALWPAP